MKTASLFKSLSEPLRLRVLNLLANTEPELCVCDLVAILQTRQAMVSRHLSQLRVAGLVKVRRHGVWMFYGLCPAKTGAHNAIVQYLKSGCNDEAELVHDLRQYAKLKTDRKLACCMPENLTGRCSSTQSTLQEDQCI